MRMIDGDALDEFLQKAEIDAEKAKKYVLRSAINTIRGNLANFPTVEPERKRGNWIPVSELPKFVKTVDEGLEDENQVSDIVLVTNGKEVGPSELGKYWDEDEPFWVDPWFYDWPIDVHMDANEIIAWMPLPEPFKGGDQE